jgi:hypothetical protein
MNIDTSVRDKELRLKKNLHFTFRNLEFSRQTQ